MAKLTISIEYDFDTQDYSMEIKNPSAKTPYSGALQAAMLLGTCYNRVAVEVNDMGDAMAAGKLN